MTASLLPWMILAAVTGEPAVTAAPPASAPQEARPSGEELFRRGVSAYDAHEYAAAIELFEKAYAADAEPAILFNIAQGYRALGDCSKAIEKIETFLNTVQPGDPLIARARAKKRELAACAAASGAKEKKIVTPLESQSEAPPPPPAARAEPPPGPPSLTLTARPMQPEPPRFFQGAMATTCAASAGGTLAFGLTSLAFAIAANSLASRVDSAMTWTPEVAADDAQRRALGQASVITGIASGGAAVIAGASCWARWHRLHGGGAH
jgi:tetratricopeptide (TPR) repeat protein